MRLDYALHHESLNILLGDSNILRSCMNGARIENEFAIKKN